MTQIRDSASDLEIVIKHGSQDDLDNSIYLAEFIRAAGRLAHALLVQYNPDIKVEGVTAWMSPALAVAVVVEWRRQMLEALAPERIPSA